MGHDYIDYGNRHVHIPDMDIWTLRHFFIHVARAATPDDFNADASTLELMSEFFEKWQWLGPGVVVGTDLTDFVNGEPSRRSSLERLLDRTIQYLSGFGDLIPLEYLQEHVNTPMTSFVASQPAQRFIREVECLREMLVKI